MEGYTAQEIADILEISLNTAKQRIFRAGLKPITKDALYDKADLEKIRNVPGKGRPRKEKPENPEK
jgi:orotate phosphoribosyltransferase-like protein